MSAKLFPKVENPLFTRGQMVSLLWPLFVEQLLVTLVGVIDILMVAFLGEAPMAGVSLAESVGYLIGQILFAITAGGTVVSATFLGAQNHAGARRTTGQLYLVSVVLMIAIMAAMLLFGHDLVILLFGAAEDAVIESADLYLVVTALSFPALAVYNTVAAVLRASGDTKTPMVASFAMNVGNIAGNALCIFVLNMGVMGVALPTTVTRVAAAVAVVVVLQRSGKPVRITGKEDFRPDGGIIRQILAIGVPGGIESGVFQLGKLILTSLVALLGTSAIAAYAVAGTLVKFLYLPGDALGAGMLTIVGQCMGAGEKLQARRYALQLTVVNYAVLLVICAALVLGIDIWVGAYQLTGDAFWYTKELVVSHCIAMVIWPIAFLWPYYFRVTGHATFSLVISTIAMWLFRVGCAYLFVVVMHLDVLWVWIAMYIDWVFRIAFYIPAFQKWSR